MRGVSTSTGSTSTRSGSSCSRMQQRRRAAAAGAAAAAQTHPSVLSGVWLHPLQHVCQVLPDLVGGLQTEELEVAHLQGQSHQPTNQRVDQLVTQ